MYEVYIKMVWIDGKPIHNHRQPCEQCVARTGATNHFPDSLTIFDDNAPFFVVTLWLELSLRTNDLWDTFKICQQLAGSYRWKKATRHLPKQPKTLHGDCTG